MMIIPPRSSLPFPVGLGEEAWLTDATELVEFVLILFAELGVDAFGVLNSDDGKIDIDPSKFNLRLTSFKKK